MACTAVHRGIRLFLCVFLLVLAKVQSTLAEEESKCGIFLALNRAELGQFPEIRDVQLRRTYMALVSMFSDTSREAGRKYGVSELEAISNDLDNHVRVVNANTKKPHRLELKRSVRKDSDGSDEEESANGVSPLGKRLLGGLGDLLGLGSAGGSADQAGGAGGAGPLGGLLSGALGNAFNRILSATGSGLAGAGFFGGIGAGQGAAQALNLSTVANTKATGDQIAQQNGMVNSGLNPLIQNAAVGLTATALKAAIDSGLLQLPPLAGLAVSLGTGLGNGGAQGLGLTQGNVGPPANGSTIDDVIGGLGFGASRALTSNLNLTGGLIPPDLDLGGLLLSAATGIGSGAAQGLKISDKQLVPPVASSNSDIPGLAGRFAFGLSNSLTENLNISSSLIPQNLDINSLLLSAATGIGSGAAQGLKISDKQLVPPVASSNSDIPGLAGRFAFGLSNSLTENLNISSSLIPENLDINSLILGAGTGIGSGAAQGLNLSGMLLVPPVAASTSDIPGLAGRFAFGLSNSLTENLNISSGLILQDLDINGLVLGAGTGIGSGAAQGLNLSSTPLVPPVAASSSDIPGLAGRFAFGLSNSLAENLVSTKNLAAMIPPIDYNSAALSVGNGIGAGAALGLKLTQNDTSGFGTPTPPSQQSLADIPKIAGTLAFGVSKSLAGAVNTNSMNVGDLIPSNLDVGSVVLGAGRGLGSGASQGLGLVSAKTLASRALSNTTFDIPDLVEKFTFGLGNSFTDKIDVASQAKNLAAQLPTVDLGATVLGVGSGLGLGSAKGLGLSAKDAEAPPAPSSLKDIPQIASTFTFGLSDAFASKLNISELTGDLMQSADGFVSKFAAPIASGLGKGLGEGTAVGLGLQPEAGASPSTQLSAANSNVDVAGLAQNFATGLTAKFLANDTVGKILTSVSGGNGTGSSISDLLPNLQISRLANGLARGLVTGAGDSVVAMGGVDALLNGTSVVPTGAIPETKIQFNDSVDGAAVGLGQGLGTSSVVTLRKLLAGGIKLKRSVPAGPETRDLAIVRRQSTNDSAVSLNLTRFVTANSVSVVGQKGIEILTCEGVAGILLVFLGLQKSGTVSLDGFDKNTTDTLKSAIPNGTIVLESEGNKYTINGTKLRGVEELSLNGILDSVRINSFSSRTYIAFLVLHIGGAIIGLYLVWPMVLTLASLQNIATRLRIPLLISRRAPKAIKILTLFVVAPSLVLILVFGVLSGASGGHFRTAHGILSIVTLIFAIAAVVLSQVAEPAELTPGEPTSKAVELGRVRLASHACNQILLALLIPTAVTGFADVSSLTLCVTRVVPFELAVSLGMGFVFVFALGMYMSFAELILVFLANRRVKKQELAEKNRHVG